MHMSIRDQLFGYIEDKYKARPEYLWRRFPGYAVFRHADNNKWFAASMDISADKLGIDSSKNVDILNIKVADPVLADLLLQQPGFFRGYHMSKGSWISVLLDGTVPLSDIKGLVEASYNATASRQKKQQNRPPREWIIPANPKYYDIEAAFKGSKEINWKQGAGIKTGDTVYVYVAAPVSAILYKCKVTGTDIPYRYDDGNVYMSALMKIKLLKSYNRDKFTFDTLGSEYGIYAIRGPRGVPRSLSEALNKGRT